MKIKLETSTKKEIINALKQGVFEPSKINQIAKLPKMEKGLRLVEILNNEVKIEVTRQHKVVLLKALETGYLETDDITELKELEDFSFMKLMMRASCIDE
jgi:F0F1-type ATP synthase alpha subunit